MEKFDEKYYRGEGFLEGELFENDPPSKKDVGGIYNNPCNYYNGADLSPYVTEENGKFEVGFDDVAEPWNNEMAIIKDVSVWDAASLVKAYSMGVNNGYEQAKKDIEEELGVKIDSLKDIIKLLGKDKKEDYYYD